MKNDFNRVSALPHTEAEKDWLDERIETLSTKEAIVLTAAISQYPPQTAADAVNLLMGLQDYEVHSPASNYKDLAALYLEEYRLNLPEAILTHTDMEALGKAYASKHPGSFLGDCYVVFPNAHPKRLYDGGNLNEVQDTNWSVKVKLASEENTEGVWLRLPDTGEADKGQGEIYFALRELHVHSLEECLTTDARYILPEAGNLLDQYDGAMDLVYDGNDLGFLLDEQGEGMPRFFEKFAAAIDCADCRTLAEILEVGQDLSSYNFVMDDEAAEWAVSKLRDCGVPDTLIDSGAFDLEEIADDLLYQAGYRLNGTVTAYVKLPDGGQMLDQQSTQEKAESNDAMWSPKM